MVCTTATIFSSCLIILVSCSRKCSAWIPAEESRPETLLSTNTSEVSELHPGRSLYPRGREVSTVMRSKCVALIVRNACCFWCDLSVLFSFFNFLVLSLDYFDLICLFSPLHALKMLQPVSYPQFAFTWHKTTIFLREWIFSCIIGNLDLLCIFCMYKSSSSLPLQFDWRNRKLAQGVFKFLFKLKI